MTKSTEKWVLFHYVGRELTSLSKPFENKEAAEKARMKYPDKERRAIALGFVRTGG